MPPLPDVFVELLPLVSVVPLPLVPEPVAPGLLVPDVPVPLLVPVAPGLLVPDELVVLLPLVAPDVAPVPDVVLVSVLPLVEVSGLPRVVSRLQPTAAKLRASEAATARTVNLTCLVFIECSGDFRRRTPAVPAAGICVVSRRWSAGRHPSARRGF